MAKQAESQPHGAALDESATPPSADRRRWLKAGLSTTPVLMTVASRPVLAQAPGLTPSAFMSGRASGPTGAECAGRSPLAWSSSDDWPSPYVPGKTAQKDEDKQSKDTRQAFGTLSSAGDQATRFNDYFEPNLKSNATFSDVLGYGNIPHASEAVHTVARYVTAALLNNAAGTVPNTVLSQSTILAIWSEYANTGSFAPTRGVSWTANEIVEYLESTMTGG
jgi:hypothetical protein